MLTTIDFVAGDVINVHQKIRELVRAPAEARHGENKMFTVLKKSGQYYIERIWPVNSPNIEKVEVVEKPRRKPRRAKLTYLTAPMHK